MAYKNGFEAGQEKAKEKAKICAKVSVAYEQLSSVHTSLCMTDPYRYDDELIYDVQDILRAILDVEVKLGMIKQE
jgi:hypothetical protein